MSILNTEGPAISHQSSRSGQLRSLINRQSEVGDPIKLSPDSEICNAVAILAVHYTPEPPDIVPMLPSLSCCQEATLAVQAVVAVYGVPTDVATDVAKVDAHMALDTPVAMCAIIDDKVGQGDSG